MLKEMEGWDNYFVIPKNSEKVTAITLSKQVKFPPTAADLYNRKGQFFRVRRPPTFEPLSDARTTGAKIQSWQSEILCNGYDQCLYPLGRHQPSLHCLGRPSCDSIPSPVATAH